MALSDPRFIIFLFFTAVIIFSIQKLYYRLAAIVIINFVFSLSLGSTSFLMPLIGIFAFEGAIVLADKSNGLLRNILFVAILSIILLPLFYYKYLYSWVGTLQPVLPVGISFYSFMVAGYIIDVFVDPNRVQFSRLNFMTFISFFPHLTAGPISRGQDFFNQLPQIGKFNYNNVVVGLRSLLVGLFMKVAIADSIAPVVDKIYSDPRSFEGIDHVIATIYFSFQVYADFAGYSLIAVGSARIIGIELCSNFNAPYLSETLPEYWRRWHISLSSWFRDYIFLPLQFNYRHFGNIGLISALVITFTLVGIWHGAGLKYSLFGLIHGIFVSVSTISISYRNMFWSRWGVPRASIRFFRIVFTFFVVSSTFILFRAHTISDAVYIYTSIITMHFGSLNVSLWPVFGCMILILGDISLSKAITFDSFPQTHRWILYHFIASCTIYFMIMHTYQGSLYANQFIYFKF